MRLLLHMLLGTFVSHQSALRTKALAKAKNMSAYLRCQDWCITVEGDPAGWAAERHTGGQ